MESTQTYSVVRSYAGHSSWQGSDKDYAICLVHLTAAGDDSASPEPDDARTWMVLFVFGRPGRLQGGSPGPLMARAEAEKEFNKKVKEKVGQHHYTPLPGLDFAPFARKFQVTLVLSGATPSPTGAAAEMEAPAAASSTADERYAGCSVTDVPLERFWQLAASSRYGTEEKVDGERCPLSRAKPGLTAFNRNGVALDDLPEKARALLSLSELPFLVDGERMVNSEQKGHYILFDLLEWQEQDIRAWPYSRRNETLQRAMHAAGLIKEICPTPTLQQAYENTTVPGLALLTPVTGREEVQRLVASIQQHKGEGMVVRDLTASYQAPNAAFKYKFTADLDAVVIGINPGAGGGSLELGLRRPLKDGEVENGVIAIGRVRAGLSKEDMGWFADQLTHGTQVVIRVRYRLKRTIGITLVEPSTSIDWVRTDKSPWECTTDQWGPEKAHMIQEAEALDDVSFEDPAHAPAFGQGSSQHRLW
ncbi:MAG: RNA ligase family protein [Blastocatellia bacterium]